jgi:hypothetical protein
MDNSKAILDSLDFQVSTACESGAADKQCPASARMIMVHKCCGYSQQVCVGHAVMADAFFRACEEKQVKPICMVCNSDHAPGVKFFTLPDTAK